jgi:hypothetical protein
LLIPVVGILLIALFFGLRRLRYKEFWEFDRLWRRIRQQRQVFARNIAVRKAAAKLQYTARQDRILSLLESCLHHDFDGFEILLDRELLEEEGVGHLWATPAQSFWRNGYDEKVVFILELSTPRHGLIGHISLHRGAGRGWLVDTDLLGIELRTSLSKAIDKCLFNGRENGLGEVSMLSSQEPETTYLNELKHRRG